MKVKTGLLFTLIVSILTFFFIQFNAYRSESDLVKSKIYDNERYLDKLKEVKKYKKKLERDTGDIQARFDSFLHKVPTNLTLQKSRIPHFQAV